MKVIKNNTTYRIISILSLFLVSVICLSTVLIWSSASPDEENLSTAEATLPIRFNAAYGTEFEGGNEYVIVNVQPGEKVEQGQIPTLYKDNQEISVDYWHSIDIKYTEEKLLNTKISKTLDLTAVVTIEDEVDDPATRPSLSVLPSGESAKIAVIPDPSTGTGYISYTASAANLLTAVQNIQTNGGDQEYILYVGTELTANASTLSAITNLTNIKKLTIITDYNIETGASATSNKKTLTLVSRTASLYAGCEIEFRNAAFEVANVYMNGYDLTLATGAYNTRATEFFGGAESGELTPSNGSVTVKVYSIGAEEPKFYGGSKDGTFNGDTYVYIYGGSTSNAIETVGGGNRAGTLNGNTYVKVDSTASISINNYLGGGYTANVNGNVRNEILNMGTSSNKGTLGIFYGGPTTGNVSGTIYNRVEGYGSNSSSTTMFYGGVYSGTVGTNGITNAIDPFTGRPKAVITSILDTSKYSGSTSRTRRFVGGNVTSGTIYGSIENTVTANHNSTGGQISGVSGGAGEDVLRPSDMNQSNIAVNETNGTIDFASGKSVASIESAALFKVYGDITTALTQGCFSTGSDSNYARAAGWGGYIKGNTSIYVGTEGLAYGDLSKSALSNSVQVDGSGNPIVTDNRVSFKYTTSTNSRGHSTGWDIVGGGGYTASSNDTGKNAIFINGDTYTRMDNVIARWTYGGGFTGVIWGNSKMELNGGIVDTLEGAGYANWITKGNASCVLYMGQVDDFMSGGGWNDFYIGGDCYALVNDGVLNAVVGGSYGSSSHHTIFGSTELEVRGGNHTGKSRRWSKLFNGGVNESGSIYGNTTLTIDVRKETRIASGNYTIDENGNKVATELNYPFKMPPRIYMSGGRPDSVNTGRIGTKGKNNVVTLNIFADEGEDVLQGANLYGDGGGSTSSTINNCQSEKIVINIDAPGSTLGNIYATQYPHYMSKEVEVNIARLGSISDISGGSSSDDFTAATFAAGGKKSVFNIGEMYVDGTEKTSVTTENDLIKVTKSMSNYTAMNVKEKSIVAQGGSITSGKAFTTASYYESKYYGGTFGDIVVDNGGFGVTTSSSMLVGGKLTVIGRSYVHSYSGLNKIIINDIEFQEDDAGERGFLEWVYYGGTSYTSKGAWFGETSGAHMVLTFRPAANINNAKKITPFNLRGTDSVGKTFLGDYDILSQSWGMGIVVPGSLIEYEVVKEKGTISHNIANAHVIDSSDPSSMEAPSSVYQIYATVGPDTAVGEGLLAISKSASIETTDGEDFRLTFTPYADGNELYWLEKADIASSHLPDNQVYTYEEVIPNADNTPVEAYWPDASKTGNVALDQEFSYTVSVSYKSDPVIIASSAIITESEAAALMSVDEITQLNSASGYPYFRTHATAETLTSIQVPLQRDSDGNITQTYREHKITYSAGQNNTEAQRITKVVSIIVVPDGSVFPKDSNNEIDRSTALIAFDSKMHIKEAANLPSDQSEAETALINGYTKASVIKITTDEDGNETIEKEYPATNNTAISDIKSVTYTSDVKVEYSYVTSEGETISKEVNVNVYENFVCKIGNTAYESLVEAVVAAQTQGGAEIEMLVDEYTAVEAMTVTTDIKITTAAKDAAVYPYRGDNTTAKVYMGEDPAATWFTVENGGKLTIDNLILNGNASENSSSDYSMFVVDSASVLELLNDVTVENFYGSQSLIENSGTLNINGASILNNTTTNAYGTIHANAASTVNMTDGTISNNTAVNGGGIYIENTAVLNMTGGIITKNTVSGQGGGIYQNGTMKISGDIKVSGNIKSYLKNEETLTMDSNVYLQETATKEGTEGMKYVEVVGELSSNSRIGFFTDTTPNISDRGVLGTILAVPGDVSITREKMEEMYNNGTFSHDQRSVNARAYYAILTDNISSSNIVLGAIEGAGVQFMFTKVDMGNTDKTLAGVEFMLYVCQSNEPDHEHEALVTDEVLTNGNCWQLHTLENDDIKAISDDSGAVDFGFLEDGVYMLVETKALSGYELPVGQWIVTINSTPNEGDNEIDIKYSGDKKPPAFLYDEENGEYKLPNMKSLALSMTGAFGIAVFVIGGAILILIALSILLKLYKRRKKKIIFF